VIEGFGPGIKASSSKFLVFGGGGGEAREVPARRVGLSNDDEAYAFTRTKVQRLCRSEKPILVQRFDGTHDDNLARRARLGSRRILMPGLPNDSCGRESSAFTPFSKGTNARPETAF